MSKKNLLHPSLDIVESYGTELAGKNIVLCVAGSVAGTDYSCLPGLGERAILDTGGDAFYFPAQDDADVEAAQKELAALLVSPPVQVAFNLKKGSLPIRGDIDMSTANDCMQKGVKILAGGNVVTSGDILLSADTNNQVNELMNTIWSDLYMSPADAQAKYDKIIASDD